MPGGTAVFHMAVRQQYAIPQSARFIILAYFPVAHFELICVLDSGAKYSATLQGKENENDTQFI